MPRSSKHKSSKHSSRDRREYSDSDKDSSVKERRSKEESGAKASKDLSSSQKRKQESKDAKDMHIAENGDYDEEHDSSKRRKERSDVVGDRWNVSEEEGAERSKRSKTSGDSKSRRGDESVGVYGGGEELTKSSGRSEGKHKDSSRKESKEGGADKERKFKERRSETLVNSDERRSSKQVAENIDHNIPSDLQSAETDSQLDKRMRKKRDGSGEGCKYTEVVEVDGKRLSKGESAKEGRQKEKRKDEKHKDKHRDEVHKDSKHGHEKQKDERPAKENTNSRFDEKHTREEKGVTDLRQKRHKPQEGDYEGDRTRELDSNIESGCDRERNQERNRIRDLDNMPSRNRDYVLDRDYDYKRDCARSWEHERDRELEHDRYFDYEGSHVDDQSAKYKDITGKRRFIDDNDECADSKYRAVKSHYADNERRTMSSVRVASDVDCRRSQSRQTHVDSFRSLEVEDLKHRDLMTEQKTKLPRAGAGFSVPPEKGPKYKSVDILVKTDDSVVDILSERSSGSKASPVGLKERSPSTRVDHRCMSSMRRSIDTEGSGWRNSIDPRDFTSGDRISRDIPPQESLLDDSSQADSSFYGRIGQGNTSIVQKTPFGAGLDRPFMGSMEEDGRDYSTARFRRSVDPGFGRLPGNTWRGVPNWTSPVPNNFAPFQHGPAHFHAMLPQFPSQAMFGMRPPMDVNHVGIPFHIHDADRFPGHLRPLAWQNMLDGTGPSHLHGWDGNNSVFRDPHHMYNNNSEWDRNRHLANSQAWESSVETWKDQSADVKDLSSPSSKHDYGLNPAIDEINQMARDEMENSDRLEEEVPETKSSCFTPPVKETSDPVLKSCEKTPDSSTLSNFDIGRFSHFYLSKLDISSELANPEVYDRCMALLSPETTHTENNIVYGGRVTANGLKPSLFPLIDNSVFQRAVNLYKKQNAEVACIKSINPITRDNSLASDSEVHVKESLDPGLDIKEDSTLFSEENTLICTSHVDEVGPYSVAGEKCQQDSMLIPSVDGGRHVDSSAKSAVQQLQTSSCEELGEPMSVSINYSSEARASEQEMNSEGTYGNCLPENNIIAAAATSLVSGSKAGNDIGCAVDEVMAVGNCLSDPLVFEDGCSKTCVSLIPESNESESLILTRIHHSESTC